MLSWREGFVCDTGVDWGGESGLSLLYSCCAIREAWMGLARHHLVQCPETEWDE